MALEAVLAHSKAKRAAKQSRGRCSSCSTALGRSHHDWRRFCRAVACRRRAFERMACARAALEAPGERADVEIDRMQVRLDAAALLVHRG